MYISNTCYICGNEVACHYMGDYDLDDYGVVNIYDGNRREGYYLCYLCAQEIVEYLEDLRNDYNE